MMTDNVIPFPSKDRDVKPGFQKPEVPKDPVATLVISDHVLAVPGEAMPYPSAPAVDSKYMEALKKQKAQE